VIAQVKQNMKMAHFAFIAPYLELIVLTDANGPKVGSYRKSRLAMRPDALRKMMFLQRMSESRTSMEYCIAKGVAKHKTDGNGYCRAHRLRPNLNRHRETGAGGGLFR
jgi:carbamate kinase